MGDEDYGAWNARPRAMLAADRRAFIDYCRPAPREFSVEPSVVSGRTNKHILAHVAGGNDQLVQEVLCAATTSTELDPALANLDTDAENARRIDERLSWTVEALIAELARTGEEMSELLARRTEEESARRYKAIGTTVRRFLRIVEHERHDHLTSNS